MSFILHAERDKDCAKAFRSYGEYVVANKSKFPTGGYALASADWYFNPREHRCPHDGWLESVTISEPSKGERSEQRTAAIRIRLLGAYHDGYIELFYPKVYSYNFDVPAAEHGHGDWRFDEFRVSPEGRLIHEIEWAGNPFNKSMRWLIEASDVEFQWVPK